jgi:hypothetical protein
MFNKIKGKYMSKEGMITRLWGPPLWHFLHTISFNYPTEPTKQDKNRYKKFILQLQYVLPCKYCRQNLKKNLKKLPLTYKYLNSRHDFSLYMYKLHELVNTMLGKKSGLTYEQVRDRYESFRAKCSSTTPKINKTKTLKKKEKGCTTALHKSSKKTKCVLKIVPEKSKISSFS